MQSNDIVEDIIDPDLEPHHYAQNIADNMIANFKPVVDPDSDEACVISKRRDSADVIHVEMSFDSLHTDRDQTYSSCAACPRDLVYVSHCLTSRTIPIIPIMRH